MKNFYYYARLNDNDICVEIVSRVDELKDVTGYIELPEYNETVRYRKWLGDQWSAETYEPDIDTVLQDKIDELETENANLKNEVTNLNETNETLIQSVAELTAIIASLQTPTE